MTSTMCGEQMAGSSALTSDSAMRTSRRARMASTSRRDGLHDALAAGGVGVADVELQGDAAGHAVDRAGIDVAGADGGDGVDDAGGERVLLDGEDDLGGGAEGVAAVGHEQRAGVAAETFDGEAVAGGRGDGGDDAEGKAFALEQRTLLDVQLNPGMVAAAGQAHAGERAGEAGGGADLGEGFVFVAALRAVEGVGAVGVEGAGEQPAAETADAEAGGLFGGEAATSSMERRGTQAAALEGADGLEAAEDADGAVVHAGVGDGVDVGAGGDGGEIGLGADPAKEGVADGVFADGEACVLGEPLEPGAGAEIVGREDDAGDGGARGERLDGGEGGEGLSSASRRAASTAIARRTGCGGFCGRLRSASCLRCADCATCANGHQAEASGGGSNLYR